jgi:hypothetical protein
MESDIKIGTCGIIFVKHKDYLEQLLLGVLGIEYDEIGFYYTYNVKNTTSYKLIMFNTIMFPSVSIKEIDLYDYLQSEDISNICYKRIRRNISDFTGIVNMIYSVKNLSKRDLMLYLLESKYISFEIINKITLKLDTTLNVNLEKIRYNLFDSGIYDKLETLNVTRNNKYKPKENKYVSIFKSALDTIIKDTELFNKILELINNKGTFSSIEIDEMIKNYFNSSQQLYNILIEGLKRGRIKSIELSYILKLFKNDLNILDNKNGLENPDILNDILIIQDNKQRINSTNAIRNILNNINENIKSGKIPHLKLNKLISNFNVLISQIDKNYNPIKLTNEDISAYGLISTNDTLISDIPIQLKDGDKLLIPMNETNFSRFNIDQLDEMLSILDIYSNGNNKFDQIRSLITKELSKKKSY